jgi:hypothetical protein
VALYNRLRGSFLHRNGILYDAEKGVSCVVRLVLRGHRGLLDAVPVHLSDAGRNLQDADRMKLVLVPMLVLLLV